MGNRRRCNTLRAATTGVAVAVVVTWGSVVWATHDEPGRGRTVKMPLVTAYAPCTAPNTLTAGLNGIPACQPAQRIDAQCGFQPPDMLHASGKVSAVSLPSGDIELRVIAKGLLCEGYTLCGALNFRASTDRCVDGPSCTVVDLNYVAEAGTNGCCIVSGGACRVKTTVNSLRFDTINVGDRAGVELYGCGLRRVSGPGPLPSDLSFRCGPIAGPTP